MLSLGFEIWDRYSICDLPITATGWLMANIHTHTHTTVNSRPFIITAHVWPTFNSPWVTHLAQQHQEFTSSSWQLTVFNIIKDTHTKAALRGVSSQLHCCKPWRPETYMSLCFTENTCWFEYYILRPRAGLFLWLARWRGIPCQTTGWLKKISCCTVSTSYFFEPPCISDVPAVGRGTFRHLKTFPFVSY